jgi:hypothetical protein
MVSTFKFCVIITNFNDRDLILYDVSVLRAKLFKSKRSKSESGQGTFLDFLYPKYLEKKENAKTKK